MAEEPLDHRLLVDEGNDLAASSAGTGENVLAEDAQEELAPGDARVEGPAGLHRWWLAGCIWRVARAWGLCTTRTLRRRRHDVPAPLRCRSEDAVVAHEVGPRRRNQRGETAKQFARLEDEDPTAVIEAPLHPVRRLAVRKRGKPLLRQRRTGSVAAQASQALPVVRVQMDTCMQRKALCRPAQRRARRT